MPAPPPTASRPHGPAAACADAGRSGRAAALPAADRRDAIAAATLPLLYAQGAGVTTRQIAEAAGIAEGTIFRVFPDKESVLIAAAELAFDPRPVVEALEAIRLDRDLEERLVEAVVILQERVTNLFQLMSVAAAITSPTTVRMFAEMPMP